MRGSRAPRGLGVRKKISGRNYVGNPSALSQPWGGDDLGRIVAPFAPAPGVAPIITVPIDDEHDDGTLKITTKAHGDASSRRRVAADSTKTRHATQLRTLADYSAWLLTQPFGTGFWISDDFLGSAIDPSTWDTIGADFATIDDSGNGGFGAAKAAMALNTKQAMVTLPLGIGTADFAFRARLRAASFDSHTVMNVGVMNSLNVGAGTYDGSNSLVASKSGSSNLTLLYSGGTLGTTPLVGTTYLDIAMFAIGGIAWALINGVLSANGPQPWTGDPSGASFGVSIDQANAGSPSDIRIDSLKLWVKR
jgi:hypothetical protein